jgi:hypothetical protein
MENRQEMETQISKKTPSNAALLSPSVLLLALPSLLALLLFFLYAMDTRSDPFATLPTELVVAIAREVATSGTHADAVAMCGSTRALRDACAGGGVNWAVLYPGVRDKFAGGAPSLVDVAIGAGRDERTKRRTLLAIHAAAFDSALLDVPDKALEGMRARRPSYAEMAAKSVDDLERTIAAAIDLTVDGADAGDDRSDCDIRSARNVDNGTDDDDVDGVDGSTDDDSDNHGNHCDFVLVSDTLEGYDLDAVQPLRIGIDAFIRSDDFMRSMAPRGPPVGFDMAALYMHAADHGPYKVISTANLTLVENGPAVGAAGLRAAVNAHLTEALVAYCKGDNGSGMLREPVDIFAAYPDTQVFFDSVDGDFGSHVIHGHSAPLAILPSLPTIGAAHRMGADREPFFWLTGSVGE